MQIKPAVIVTRALATVCVVVTSINHFRMGVRDPTTTEIGLVVTYLVLMASWMMLANQMEKQNPAEQQSSAEIEEWPGIVDDADDDVKSNYQEFTTEQGEVWETHDGGNTWALVYHTRVPEWERKAGDAWFNEVNR